MDNLFEWYEVPVEGDAGSIQYDDYVEQVEGDAGSIQYDDYVETILSDLEPITASEAERLGAYARKLKCASRGNDSRPVAWSMVNAFSTHRTLALAYALANADPERTGVPPTMVDRELTLDGITAFAQHPSLLTLRRVRFYRVSPSPRLLTTKFAVLKSILPPVRTPLCGDKRKIEKSESRRHTNIRKRKA